MTIKCSCKRGILVGGTCELALTLANLLIRRDIAPVLTYRNDRGLRAIQETLGVPEDRYETRRLDFSDGNSLATLFPPDDPPFDFMVDFVQGDYEALLAAANDEAVSSFFAENVSFRAALLKRVARGMLRSRTREARLYLLGRGGESRSRPGILCSLQTGVRGAVSQSRHRDGRTGAYDRNSPARVL